jgi:hypothetical protein
MAKAHSTHLLRGKIGNLIYRVRDGKQLVHLAPAPWQERTRYQRRLRYDGFRLNIEQFAGASATASGLYGQLFSDLNTLVRPYTHNRLTARLKKSGDRHHRCIVTPDGKVHASAYRVIDAWKAFHGLDLSHEGAPVKQITMTPVGPQHNPTAVRISGLRDAARAIHTHGNARLEARIHIRQTNFGEMAFNPEDKEWQPRDPTYTPTQHRGCTHARPSGWIPAEVLPKGDLNLPLPASPDGDKFLTAIIIEWREVRTVHEKEIPHPKQAIARIVAVHGNPEDFTEPIKTGTHPHGEDGGDSDPWAFTPQNDWRKKPQQFLEEAIFHIRT